MTRATITVDLGFGDAGKGSIVDYLSRPGSDVVAVVRYNGGPQAAHRVVQPDGREHVFSQFGSGTFHDGVRTLLGPRVLVNPLNLVRENDHLRSVGVDDALGRLAIDSRCVLVTPFHAAANRIRELLRGSNRHGSCGQGVGEARADELAGWRIRAGDAIRSRTALFRKLVEIQTRKHEEIHRLLLPRLEIPDGVYEPFRVLGDLTVCAALADAYADILAPLVVRGAGYLRDLLEDGRVVFEGAQGVLLDETYGFHPYTTWTDTTARPAVELLAEADCDDYETLGIIRAYQTRHGPGPLPTEDALLTSLLPDAENGAGDWQGQFRVGHLDLELLRYALEICPVDEIAVTCLDRVASFVPWRVSPLYLDYRNTPKPLRPSCDPDEHAARLLEALERARPILRTCPPTVEAYSWLLETMTSVPATLFSTGPTADDKTQRVVQR